MAIPRWQPRHQLSKQEGRILHYVRRVRKLFSFLRLHRHEIFDDGFQAELEAMYRGAGKSPLPPAQLAMVVLLQSYLGTSDAEAVQMSVVDLRWQMVLDCIGAEQPPFSQGAIHNLRVRLVRTNMDQRLLERTVEVARESGGFDWKKLPKELDVAIDSSPQEGCGRVEDTVHLLGHPARNVVQCTAKVLGWTAEMVAKKAGIPLLLGGSVKKEMDVDWADEEAKEEAIDGLAKQVEALQNWMTTSLPGQVVQDPTLKSHVKTLNDIRLQDLEPANEDGKIRIRDGVAKDRRISITDPESRHGRKSKTRRVDGFKRHIASDLESRLILACAVTPANLPEGVAGEQLKADVNRQGLDIGGLHIDRAYLSSPVVDDVLSKDGDVVCKPWLTRNGQLFNKADFIIDLDEETITCPAGSSQPFERGMTVHFDPDNCDSCELRSQLLRCDPGGSACCTVDDRD